MNIIAKRSVISHYSRGANACACCGDGNFIFLGIDHVNGKTWSGRRPNEEGGGGLYRRLIRQGYPAGYQVLCFNCNYAKSQGGCPHQHVKAADAAIAEAFGTKKELDLVTAFDRALRRV